MTRTSASVWLATRITRLKRGQTAEVRILNNSTVIGLVKPIKIIKIIKSSIILQITFTKKTLNEYCCPKTFGSQTEMSVRMVHMAVTRTRPERRARTWWAATSVPVTRDGKAMGSPTVEVTNRMTYCNLLLNSNSLTTNFDQ